MGKKVNEEKQSAIKRSKKEKKVEKKEQLPQQESSKTRKGRPPKKKRIQTEEQARDNTYTQDELVRNNFLKYLYDIGFDKGIVIKEADRKKLQEEQNMQERKENNRSLEKIIWKDKHSWDYQEEKEKASNLISQYFPLFSQQQKQALSDNFLNMGEIFADQVTEEVYTIVINLIKLKRESENLNEDVLLRNYAKKVMKSKKEYIFLTARYSQLCAFQAKCTEQKMEGYLVKLFKESFKYIGEILERIYELQ